jgi:hypothetical protein
MEVVPGSVPAAQQTSINLGCGLGSGVNGVSGAEGMDIDAPAEAVSADVGATQTSAEPGAVSEDSAGKREADRARFSNDELRHLAISMADFEVAVTKVQPSLRREGFTTKPDVTWQDVVSSILNRNVHCVQASSGHFLSACCSRAQQSMHDV